MAWGEMTQLYIDSDNDCSNTYTNDGTNACKFIAANGMKQI
jgi:hypothetical protein